ncbi:integrase catalytic domain-containing protein [Nephila pilipes]|uniref:Integrase catalytic domain-containing protein n=1 Tax=Nephila pilipes TaxID=299642 RepID=A0A8X6PHU0_NEPPI|nr:integrase catalytic domain-containing protein [Nephila pilipes]
MRKWISNDTTLMSQWAAKGFDTYPVDTFVSLGSNKTKVLGLTWQTLDDCLTLDNKGLLEFISTNKNTKRFLLPAIGKIFDPFGLISPFTIRMKCLIQELWKNKITWDEELPPKIVERWSTKIKSEARELVQSFPITNENYPLAIESLTERYGRKELLIDFYVRELLKLVLSSATKKKQDSLSSLYNKLSTQIRALSSLGVTTDQCGVILYPLVESSLPTHILRSFERERKNIDSEQSISTLDATVSFLKSEMQSEEKIKLSRSEILPYERECKHLAKSQNTLPAAAELFIQESIYIYKRNTTD